MFSSKNIFIELSKREKVSNYTLFYYDKASSEAVNYCIIANKKAMLTFSQHGLFNCALPP